MSSSDDAIRAWKDPHAEGHFDDHPAGRIDLGPPWSVEPTSNVTKTFETTDGGWDLFFPVSDGSDGSDESDESDDNATVDGIDGVDRA